MKYDVFISYSRKDTPIADRVCEAFDRAGITYFIDRQGIAGGMEFPQVLANAIEESTLFLFIASENSYQSKFTNNEVLFAFNEKPHNTLLPYIIDGTRMPASLRFTFASINVRNIKEHPIEPVLVDDVLRLLGREEEDSVHRQAAQEAAARQTAMEAERKAKEEAQRKAKQEAERKAKEEAERKAKEEAERKAKEEAERLAKVEAERKAKEEAERKAKEEAERLAKVEAERKAKQETEIKAKETVKDAVVTGVKYGMATLKATGSPAVAATVATGAAIGSVTKQMKKETPKAAPMLEKTEDEKKALAESREQRAKEKAAQKAERVEKAQKKERENVKSGYVLVGQGVRMLGKKKAEEFRDAENIQVAESVISINNAFNGNITLKNIILPARLKTIPSNAFYGCSSLEKIFIPDSVTHIYSYAFQNCINLKELVFAKNATIESIESGAFEGCTQLQSVVIPASVKVIEYEAFRHCDKLKEVRLMNPDTKYTKTSGLFLKRTFPSHTKIIKG